MGSQDTSPHHPSFANSQTRITGGPRDLTESTYLIFVRISPDGRSYFKGKYHQEEHKKLEGKKGGGRGTILANQKSKGYPGKQRGIAILWDRAPGDTNGAVPRSGGAERAKPGRRVKVAAGKARVQGAPALVISKELIRSQSMIKTTAHSQNHRDLRK